MSVVILDGAMVRDFVEDENCFNGSVEARFDALDTDNDGLLSYAEMFRELESIVAVNGCFSGVDEATRASPEDLQLLFSSLFSQFDRDSSGAVDLDEFRSETREILLAVANGLGFLPVQMVLEDGSLIKMAVDRESTRLMSPRSLLSDGL